ncbi:MAG TPA: hydroxymethylglutaryl-CoA synthase, partial [bacterium]|nr:hydroxymethylglutaryl-CoA synthase [bacterium]
MVGIIGYGAYIPCYRIKAEEIARIWGQDASKITEGLLIEEKSVPGLDEDSITIAVEAGHNAVRMAGINPVRIGALYSGTESKAYAVKPNATIIGEALGLGYRYMSADL